MANVNKKSFKVEVDGKEIEVAVVRPNHKVSQQASLIFNQHVRKGADSGLMLRAEVERLMRERNTWDDAKQKRYDELFKKIRVGEISLAKGGIKLSEAREIAVDMRRARAELRLLMAERNHLDQHTAEAHAEQAKFNYLVSACTVYSDTGKTYYKDVDDYLARENDPVVFQAAQALGQLIYGLEDNFDEKLPENVFLKARGFVNNELHLIRKSDGKLVDVDGRLVDDFGRLVNEQGELIDVDGNPLTEDGEYKVEFTEFIDDTSCAPVAERAEPADEE